MAVLPVIFDSRWIGEHGIGRFASELRERLPVRDIECCGRPMSPLDPVRLSLFLSKKSNQCSYFISPGYNAPLFGDRSYFLTIHDLNHLDRTENSNFAKRLYYRFVLSRLCNRARGIFTVSEYSRQRIIDWLGVDGSKVHNVGNGISASILVSNSSSNELGEYVLCVSNRKGHKNEPSLMRAFQLACLPQNVKLVFTGSPSEELIELASSLSISNQVVFSGRVDEMELGGLYRGALFLMFPSLYEGFGLPVVEAFACGTPVITSNLTAMPEVAGDAALLIDPYDIGEMASSISLLYRSPALRMELASKGLERAKEYTWDRVAERVMKAVGIFD